MTATKPTTSTPESPVPKKTVRFAKKAGSAKFRSAAVAAAAEKKSIDALLQSMNTHRLHPRRGSKTHGMLSASASSFVFDTELSFGRDKLESVSEITLLNALQQLDILKD
jgi:hypothetical protein